MLQQHSSLKTIKKKLIRKALDMIRKLAEEDPDESVDKKGMYLPCTLFLSLIPKKSFLVYHVLISNEKLVH